MELEAQERYAEFLAERKAEIEERMVAAAQHAGRDVAEVSLLAVSKTVGVDEVALACQAGYRLFGENRPQELSRKLSALRDDPVMAGVRFDMIGNLQKNKINQVLGQAELIHSVSSLHLAEAISKRAEVRGLTARVLLEVNVSGELAKSGFAPEETTIALERIMALPSIAVEGVMTMAPAHDASAARATFAGLTALAGRRRASSGLPLEVISCGMSDDFQIAVEEGSTLLRLGRTVFDPAYVLS